MAFNDDSENTTTQATHISSTNKKLPLAGLLALAMAAFITLLTEIMPAGLLSSIAQGLNVSENLAGQFITVYAVGAVIAAIPVTVLTQNIRRRPLLLTTILGFAVVNLITAISDNYLLSLIARFFAGVFGGIVWSLLAGYAVRMSPPHLSGRAIAISGAGATAALVLGVPLGSMLGQAIGWQGAFGLMSLLALILMVWIIAVVPDFLGQTKTEQQPLLKVFCQKGIRDTLFVVMTFVVAHNLLYIYIEPSLKPSNLSTHVDSVLLVFGMGSIVGLWFVGLLIVHWLKFLAVGCIVSFALAALLFALWGDLAAMVYLSVAIWGIAFGGFATITQTILSRFAGRSIDVAQSIYTTAWNIAVASAGILGGVLLGRISVTTFAWIIIAILIASLLGAVLFMNRALAQKN